MQTVTPKVWYTSKVLWFNALTLILAVIGFLMVTQSAGGLPFEVDPRWLIIISGVGNIILRFLTNAPVTGGK